MVGHVSGASRLFQVPGRQVEKPLCTEYHIDWIKTQYEDPIQQFPGNFSYTEGKSGRGDNMDNPAIRPFCLSINGFRRIHS